MIKPNKTYDELLKEKGYIILERKFEVYKGFFGSIRIELVCDKEGKLWLHNPLYGMLSRENKLNVVTSLKWL